MVRIPDPESRYGPEAGTLLETLIEERGTVDGLYRTMLLNPGLSRAFSNLGAYLRYESDSLTDRQRELVILRVAGVNRSAYEWIKHVPPGLEAGIDEETIEALRVGEIPDSLTAGEKAMLEATDIALGREGLPEGLQAALLEELGEDGTIELVILTGIYAATAGFLAAFEVPLPEGFGDPFSGTSRD